MRAFCPSCATVRDVHLDSREESYEVRGELIPGTHSFYVCETCGSEFSSAEQAQRSLSQVREAFRSRHGLVTPDEIRSIRARYGAGQKPFGLILGLGETTINSYEKGELPTTANSNLIRTASDPTVFARLYEAARNLVGPTQQKRIEEKLDAFSHYSVEQFYEIDLREEPSEYTGFRPPDSERILLLFHAILGTLGEPTHKTKLLKLAYLCDTEHFRRHTLSITGWLYARLPYGPVPQDYKQLLAMAERNGLLETDDLDDGQTLLLAANKERDNELESEFSTSEKATIEAVLKKWGSWTAGQLSDFTHKLKAWTETPNAQKISYATVLEEDRK